MGQYFKLVNEDKREIVDPWTAHDVTVDGSGAPSKFYEWLYNNHARLLVWLLRRSNEGGGGDVENMPRFRTLGRWAGDRVSLIGDGDDSKLYQKATEQYTDITRELYREYNQGCDIPAFRV